jgi:hypothetical protein
MLLAPLTQLGFLHRTRCLARIGVCRRRWVSGVREATSQFRLRRLSRVGLHRHSGLSQSSVDSMDRFKGFLTKTGPFGVPVYAYAIGVVALIGGVWYFKTHASSTGAANTAPQTNYPATATPLPYPDPGSGAAGIPPSSAFDTSSATSVAQYTPQSNFVPAISQPTSSDSFGNTVQGTPPYPSQQTPTPSGGIQYVTPNTNTAVASLVNVPILGNIIRQLVSAPHPSAPTASSRTTPTVR